MWVVQRQEPEAWADGSVIVVAVYGVLFLDWNSQGSPENQPFHGVWCQSCNEMFSMLTQPRFEHGSSDWPGRYGRKIRFGGKKVQRRFLQLLARVNETGSGFHGAV